ncbi:ABC transporter ATP-binding protein [Catellatospora citrea]|uniref:ABC transporter ATP-binding protein n=1 Tax=Catellatospora citrea TaxID=53366 RepID=UPI0033FBB808
MSLLETTGLTRSYGPLTAVDGIDLHVMAGTRHAVIGPNGAGKSTLFGLVAGAVPRSAGRIVFDGTDVGAEPEHRRARRGIVRTFQHSRLLLGHTVCENVLVAVHRCAGVGGRALPLPRRRRAELAELAMSCLSRVGLAARHAEPAGRLSHGERRQLEIAVALAGRPRLLLLDEPAAGMSAAETRRLADLVRSLPSEVTVLLVEHNLDLVFELADTVSVLHLGRLVRTGSPDEVRADEAVRAAYLGNADEGELWEAAHA